MKFKKLFSLLSKEERRQSLALLGMILIMSLLDVLGVASIMPFMAVLGNPELVETNFILSWAYDFFEFTNKQDFFIFLGGVVFVTLVVSLAWKAVTQYKLLSFSFMREHSIGVRMLEGYLNQPYVWFLNRNSAELGKNLLSEIRDVISKSLIPTISLISQGAVSLVIFTMLFIIDYELAISVFLVLGLFYGLIYKSISKLLLRMGSMRYNSNSDRFKIASESFSAIKEVKIGSLEDLYTKRFDRPAKEFAKSESKLATIAQLPRYALEVIAFGGLLLVLLSALDDNKGLTQVLPIVALYAFAGYRLMPSMQIIYSSIALLRYSGKILDELHNEIMNLGKFDSKIDKDNISLTHKITLNNVNFNYPGMNRAVLHDISLSIPANSVVGFVGSTGSGKTTLVDIILGLLEPKRGSLMVDGVTVNSKNKTNWQNALGYVPQQISLIDASLADNIAFGVEPDEINMDTVQNVSRIASLHDFVVNNLKDGYDTVIGERGVRLSGGQRQRIGIARALYHKPCVLVLDEATSALDNVTESMVMESVQNLGHEITIIIIAHRLSTVRDCDIIYRLDNGNIVSKGTYEELLDHDKDFCKMAKYEYDNKA
jgi:ATP-binding cassette, subfamily B, bacterial PglK